MESRKNEDRAHDLAAKIYVALVAANTEVTADSVKLKSSASNIATLSLRLSDAFIQAEDAAAVAKEPKKTHTLEGSDIASWGTK